MAIDNKLKTRLLSALRTPEAVALMEEALENAGGTPTNPPEQYYDGDNFPQNWPQQPSSIGDALNKLAARVKALEDAP